MSSLRESPTRPRGHRRSRPPWLIPVLVVVGVIVVLGILIAMIRLIGGGGDEPAAQSGSESPLPCVTTTVAAGSVLPNPGKVKVRVYNATTSVGLAAKTGVTLGNRGFDVRKTDNDPVGRTITGVGQIRFGPKAEQQAQLLLVYVPGAELVPLDRNGKVVDLAVGKAFTGIASDEDVTAALQQPTPVASGAGCVSPAASAAASGSASGE